MVNHRSRVAGGALVLLAAAAILFTCTQALTGDAASEPEKKTLASVMKRMKYYNKALGVDCDYCHVPNRFEIDTPRRKTASWMQVHLVEGLVSREGQKPIDCHTCHDGRARFLPSSQ